MLTCNNGNINVNQGKGIESYDIITKYIYAFYWSIVTTMTVGYGDISGQNVYEIAFGIIAILLGCALYAYYINKIGMILQQMNQKDIRYQEQYAILSEYMRKR